MHFGKLVNSIEDGAVGKTMCGVLQVLFTSRSSFSCFLTIDIFANDFLTSNIINFYYFCLPLSGLFFKSSTHPNTSLFSSITLAYSKHNLYI